MAIGRDGRVGLHAHYNHNTDTLITTLACLHALCMHEIEMSQPMLLAARRAVSSGQVHVTAAEHPEHLHACSVMGRERAMHFCSPC